MIKLTFCLVRLPRLSREAFQKYWYDTHAPPVASAGIRASRDAPPEFDGEAELWFDSLEALAENGRRPEAQAAGARLLQDEKRFIDPPKSPLWWGQERVVMGQA
jgi:hypothetical protein